MRTDEAALLLAFALGCSVPAASVAPCPSALAPAVASAKSTALEAREVAPCVRADPLLGVCGGAVDLTRLEDSGWVRVAATSHGHFGRMELHVDLERMYGSEAFSGTMTATLADGNREPVADTQSVDVSREKINALIVTLRDGARTEAGESDTRNVYVTDSSRSEVIFVDMMKTREARGGASGERRAHHHVQFVAEGAETSPAPWRLRACGQPFAYGAQDASTKAYGRFLDAIGRQPFLDALQKRARAAPLKKPHGSSRLNDAGVGP